MNIELDWDTVVPNVVHYRFLPGWSWEDFRKTALQEHEWGKSAGVDRYDIIADLSKATIPRGTAFSNIVGLFDKGPENRITIVAVGSPLARTMITVGERIYPRIKGRFHYADTVEQARALIVSMRKQANSS